MEQLIDLGCEIRSYDRGACGSAQSVVSDVAALLWSRLRDSCSFAGFAQRAAPQLIPLESRHGWTRGGWGRIPEKETSLTNVLARMLEAPDMWGGADHYLDALDHVTDDGQDRSARRDTDFKRDPLRAQKISNERRADGAMS
jgi:hypothetical protein